MFTTAWWLCRAWHRIRVADISFEALFYFSWFSLSVVIQTSIASLAVPDITSLHLEGEKKHGLCQGPLGKLPHPIWTESNLKKISIASNCLKTAGRSFLRPWTKTNSLYGHLSHGLCKQCWGYMKVVTVILLCTFTWRNLRQTAFHFVLPVIADVWRPAKHCECAVIHVDHYKNASHLRMVWS